MSASHRILTAIRPITRKGPGYWIRFAVLLAAGWYVGHLLSGSKWLTQLRYALYHRQLMMRNRTELYPQRTALVLLDDDDYWSNDFQARSPLKRNVLADLLDRLDTAGVKTVALDVDLRSPLLTTPEFEFPDYKDEDAKLIEAIGRMCASHRHVVLASSISFDADGYHEMPSIYTSSLPHLPCLQRGYIQLPFDMRRIPGVLDLADGGHLDSLSLAVTGIADPTAYKIASAETEKGFRFSEYLTAADFGPRDGRQFVFSGQQLRQMMPDQLQNQLADKLVFLGANWHSEAYGTGPTVDTHASPGGLEPGVMLHANYVEAMLDRTGTFAPMADSTGEVLEVLLALALAFIGALEIHSAWKWAAFALGCVLSLVLTYTLLQNLGIFLDFLVPFMIIVFHTLAEELIGMWHELRRAKLQLKKPPAEVFK